MCWFLSVRATPRTRVGLLLLRSDLWRAGQRATSALSRLQALLTTCAGGGQGASFAYRYLNLTLDFSTHVHVWGSPLRVAELELSQINMSKIVSDIPSLTL